MIIYCSIPRAEQINDVATTTLCAAALALANQQLRPQSFFNLAVVAFNRGDMAAARCYAEHVADNDRFGARARELLGRIRPPA